MNTPTPASIPPASAGNKTSPDPDLDDQALPGHGIPSQDPDPEAQYGLTPDESERESKSALMGGGVMAGAAAGAAVGVAVAGPVGVFVGGTVGALAGALGGAAAGQAPPAEAPTDGEDKPISEPPLAPADKST